MIEGLDYDDLSIKVYKALKQLILSGDLQPGQKLRQEELSERLGVSRTPLLSAFSKLAKEMLVELVPRRGAFVKRFTAAELLELYDIRIRLETLGAEEAAARSDNKGLERIKEALDSYKESIRTGDPVLIRQRDYAFHMRVVEESGNSLLLNILSSFNILFISNQRGLLIPAARSSANHERLFEAIRNRSPQEAGAIMRDHITATRDSLALQMAEAANEPSLADMVNTPDKGKSSATADSGTKP
jgi:DNA-binding GntR family transcriptional regulator